jgi:hypothetical protein
MKKLFVSLLVALFLLPPTMHAQSVLQPGQPAQSDPPAGVDAPKRQLLYGGESIRRGMVWRADSQRNQWVQAEANSCEFCGKPMTWKKAAFDKKALPLWLIAAGLSVADTEYTLSRPCIKNGTCTEWNPLLGTTRAQQYGVRMPMLAIAWAATSWLRKGDDQKNIGGMRHWYTFPMIYMSMPAAGLTANAIRTR